MFSFFIINFNSVKSIILRVNINFLNILYLVNKKKLNIYIFNSNAKALESRFQVKNQLEIGKKEVLFVVLR